MKAMRLILLSVQLAFLAACTHVMEVPKRERCSHMLALNGNRSKWL